MINYWFTADQHYGHTKIIKYCDRPFADVKEMDEVLIANHNEVVGARDIVIHAGDFTLGSDNSYISRLNGEHVFVRGCHDKWMNGAFPVTLQMWEKKIHGQLIVLCHYAMRTWKKSHWNSWQLHGHSHGKLSPIGKQHDIGVDNNNFYPVSFDEIQSIMDWRPDNPNLIKKDHDSVNE